MNYPLRSDSHIKEKQAIQLFCKILPIDWVIRDINERDYGVDKIVEIPKQNSKELLPYRFAFQIKFRNNLHEGLIIKTSTYNYLHNSNDPGFIFITDGNNSKICCISYFNINNFKELNCQIPDNLFHYITDQQDLVNYICFFGHLCLNKDKITLIITNIYYDFEMILEFLKNNNIDSLWEYYIHNSQKIHNLLIYFNFGLFYLRDYIKLDISIEQLRNGLYEKKDIYELMLITSSCILVEAENLGKDINKNKKKELINLTKLNSINSIY